MSIQKQFVLLCAITLLFVGPHLLLHGTNSITENFAQAAKAISLRHSPYGGSYFFAPAFTLFYQIFSSLPERAQAFTWGVLGLSVFWCGVSAWFNRTQRWHWISLIVASMELDGSLRYQEPYAILVGGLLLATYFFERKKYFLSGLLFANLSSLSPLPTIVFAFLLFPIRLRFLSGILSGGALMFLIPALLLGWDWNRMLYQEWLGLIYSNGLKAMVYLRSPFLVLAWLLTLFSAFRARVLGDNGLFLSLILLLPLLIHPPASSPSFILAVPSYLFLWKACENNEGFARNTLLVLWAFGTFLITLCMNDLWPRWVWNPGPLMHLNKTIGAFCLWSAALFLTAISKLKYSHPFLFSRR